MRMTPVLPVPRLAAKAVNVAIGLGLAGADEGEIRRNEAARMAAVTLRRFITAPSFGGCARVAQPRGGSPGTRSFATVPRADHLATAPSNILRDPTPRHG